MFLNNTKPNHKHQRYPLEWTKDFFKTDAGDLSASATRATLWLFLEKLADRLTRLIFTAIFARLLTPKDFGLVGAAGLLLGIVRTLGNFGFQSAIIQKKEINHIYLSTAFWFNTIVGVILWIFILALSPLSVWYFNDADVKNVLIVISFSFIFNGLSNVHGTIWIKDLKFGRLAALDFFSNFSARIIILLYALIIKANYWALVIGDLSVSAINMATRYYYNKWRPSLIFDRDAFRHMFHYGKNIFFFGILNYFTANVDYLIVGRRLGVDILGIYFIAYSIPHVVVREFSQVLMKVLFPVLSKVQDDEERFKNGYLKCIKFISMISFPTCMGMMITGEYFIRVLYGQKWEAAIIPFKILCFSGMAKSLLTTMGSIYRSKGRPDMELRWNLIFSPIIISAVLIGSYFGLTGVTIAMAVTSYLSFVTLWRAFHLANIRFKWFIRSIRPAMTGTILMLASVFFFNHYILQGRNLSNFACLLLLTVLGSCVYGAYMIAFSRENVLELINMIKKGTKRS